MIKDTSLNWLLEVSPKVPSLDNFTRLGAGISGPGSTILGQERRYRGYIGALVVGRKDDYPIYEIRNSGTVG